jgi:exonuclease SbcD
MRFVHFSDTHLGRKNFKIDERERDFERAFKQVIDFALEKKVDFVIHSGDIVDTGKPSYGTINFLVTQLKRLKKEDIPFFTVPGSHDVAPDGTIISVLDSAGFLRNLGSAKYHETKEEKIILKGEVYRDAFIAGMMGKRARIEETYKKIVPEFQKSKFKIFIFHHIIHDISKRFGDIPKEVLPKGFDYYAGGHTHGKFVAKYGNGSIVYPGSTEVWDAREKGEKGFFYFDDKLEWVPLKTREFVELEIDVHGNPEEITDGIIKRVMESDKAILLVRVKGKLTSGSKSEINRNRIVEAALGKGYIFANIYLSDLNNPEEEAIESEERSLEQIERDYLEKHGYSGKELQLAMEMIRCFGKKINQSESEKATGELISMGEEI